MTFEEYTKSLGFDLRNGRVYFDTYEMAKDCSYQYQDNGIRVEIRANNMAGYAPHNVLNKYRYYICEVKKEQDATV